jgi:hypothetical protein
MLNYSGNDEWFVAPYVYVHWKAVDVLYEPSVREKAACKKWPKATNEEIYELIRAIFKAKVVERFWLKRRSRGN